jgi:hypothetical protein
MPVSDVNVKIRPRSFWNGDSLDLSRAGRTCSGCTVTISAFGRSVRVGPASDARELAYLPHPRVFDYHVGMTCFETDGLPAEWQQPMRSWTRSGRTATGARRSSANRAFASADPRHSPRRRRRSFQSECRAVGRASRREFQGPVPLRRELRLDGAEEPVGPSESVLLRV